MAKITALGGAGSSSALSPPASVLRGGHVRSISTNHGDLELKVLSGAIWQPLP